MNKSKHSTSTHNRSGALPLSRHWARSSTIDLGIAVSHRLSEQSMIRYPALFHSSQQESKKIAQQTNAQHLPKLLVVPAHQQQLFEGKQSGISVAHDRASVASQLEKKNQVLPKISSSQSPLMIARSDLVSENADHEESGQLGEDDAQWIALQQESLTKTALDTCPSSDVIEIKAGIDQRTFTVAKTVLFQSITLEHIYYASRNHFIEKETGVCLNSLPSGHHFAFILEYLNRTYLRKKNVDLSMYRKFDIPPSYLVDIMEYSLYLDLSPLVDHCAASIARQYEVVHTIYTLPGPLIKTVLKQLGVGDLILVERKLKNSADLNLLPSIWCEKYLKLLSHTNHSDVDKVSVDIKNCKRLCLQFYVGQALQNILKGGNAVGTEKLFQILSYEGLLIHDLVIKSLGRVQRSLSLEFWKTFFDFCPNCNSFVIHCDQFDSTFSNLLTSTYFLNNPSLSISLKLHFAEGVNSLSGITPFCKSPSNLTSTLLKNTEVKKFNHLLLEAEAKFNISSATTLQDNKERIVTQRAVPCSVSLIYDPTAKKKIMPESESLFNQILSSNSFVYPFITELCFSNITLHDISPLCQLLEFDSLNLSLQKISLQNVVIEMPSFNQLLYSMSCKAVHEQLTVLEIVNVICGGTDDQVLEASKLLGILVSSCSKLTHLNLEGNTISTAGMRQICEILPRCNSKKMTKLNMSNLNVLTVLPMISKWSRVYKNVELKFQNCRLAPRHINSFLPNLGASIKLLDLSFNFIDQTFIECFQQWASSSHLETLCLSGCKGITDFQFLIPAKKLKQVEMSEIDLQDGHLMALSRLWAQGQLLQVTKWSFCNNLLTEVSIKCLKDTMSEAILKEGALVKKTHIEVDVRGNSVTTAYQVAVCARYARVGFEGLFLKL